MNVQLSSTVKAATICHYLLLYNQTLIQNVYLALILVQAAINWLVIHVWLVIFSLIFNVSANVSRCHINYHKYPLIILGECVKDAIL